jgi:hypothetical protein
MFGSSLKQICFAACMLTSLLIGSVSACSCSHHSGEIEKPKIETTSCHSHAEGDKSKQVQTDHFAPGDGCICAETAQRTAAKSDAVKLNKFTATVVPDALQTIATREQRHATSVTFAEKPLYLSDSFYYLAPKRGPPRA